MGGGLGMQHEGHGLDACVVGSGEARPGSPQHECFWRSLRGEAATELISPTVGGANLPMINYASTTPAADVCSEDPWAPRTCRRVMDDTVPHLPTFSLSLLFAATAADPWE